MAKAYPLEQSVRMHRNSSLITINSSGSNDPKSVLQATIFGRYSELDFKLYTDVFQLRQGRQIVS